MTFTKTRRQAEIARRAILQTAGGTTPLVIVTFVGLGLSLNWFASASYELVGKIPATSLLAGTTWQIGLGMITFPILVGFLWVRARAAVASTRLYFNRPSQHHAAAIILFLSPGYERDLATVAGIADRSADVSELQDWNFRKTFVGPWRMPLEALAFHAPRLRFAVVVCSRTVNYTMQDNTSGTRKGTNTEFEAFKGLLQRVLPAAETVDVATLAAPAGSTQSNLGFDFEDADNLASGVEAGLRWLTDDKRVDVGDIVIDVTGGSKVASIVGAGLALEEGRRFQYVSQNDYRIRFYDPGYASAKDD